VRFLDRDAMLLPYIFADGEIDRIYINFCDPWPRSHDAKHRLTAPGFLRKYASALSDGGEIHFKTDNSPLFAWSLEQFRSERWALSEVTNDLHAGGPAGIMTDYEAKFYGEGIPINRLVAARTASHENQRRRRAAPYVQRRDRAALSDFRAFRKR
jgi:tRNA (guanine-N7-)-methyltransferase